MSDNINITVVEQPIAVTQAITESPVNVAIAIVETPVTVGIDVDGSTISIAVAITETPIAVSVIATQGIEEAPVNGTTYGRQNAQWVAVAVTETDPVFLASPAALITNMLIGNWNTAFAWGNHASAGYLTAESDPVFSASQAANITGQHITDLNSVTAFARTILDDANAAAVRTTIGAGTGNGDLLAANNLSDLASVATARTNLGLTSIATAAVPLAASLGGTGIANGASATLTLPNAALTLAAAGAYTLTIPATGTAAIDTVDKLANIITLTPTAGRIAFATTVSASDTRTVYKFMVADGTNWREVELPMSTRTGVDMGFEIDSGQNGYGTDYITDKYLYSVAIGGHPKNPVNGSFRLNSSNDPDTLEVYMRSTAWFTILYDLTTASGDLRHTPLSEAIYIWRGDSVGVGLNGQPVVQEYQTSMGAYPPYRVMNGGTF